MNAQEKQNKHFLSISHGANISCHFLFSQDYRTFFISESKEEPKRFY